MERRAHTRSGAIATLALALSLACAAPALAADPEKALAPDAAQRQKMAEVHRKMAECLESSRPIGQCRDEMQQSCRGMMGEASCPMMGPGAGGMGHGMGGPMHPPETPPK